MTVEGGARSPATAAAPADVGASAAAHTHANYRKWDAFDADAAMAEVDGGAPATKPPPKPTTAAQAATAKKAADLAKELTESKGDEPDYEQKINKLSFSMKQMADALDGGDPGEGYDPDTAARRRWRKLDGFRQDDDLPPKPPAAGAKRGRAGAAAGAAGPKQWTREELEAEERAERDMFAQLMNGTTGFSSDEEDG